MFENSGKQLFVKIFIVALILVCIKFYFENLKMQDKLKYTELAISNVKDKNNGASANPGVNQIDSKLDSLTKTLNEMANKLNNFNNASSILDKLEQHLKSENEKKTQIEVENVKKDEKIVQPEQQTDNSKPNVVIFDLGQPLEPANLYSGIQCRKSATYHVSTTLCVHNLNNDVHVSGSIWRDGVWEPHILGPFADYVHKHSDWLVMDVGAQIGQYSLFAAKMGRDVITVEPFYDNILRIHKAAKEEKIEAKIKLIKNAISDKRNEVKLLQVSDNNIGGQSLLNHKGETFTKDANNKYLVETILFDDIIPHLPKKSDGKNYEKAILKIDIEGFEPYAFTNAKKLFDLIEIPIVYMEWGNLPQQSDAHQLIKNMIDFMESYKLMPYGNGQRLQKNSWMNWPWDIIFKKDGY